MTSHAERVRDLLAAGDLRGALAQLASVAGSSRETSNEITLYSGRLADIDKRERLGITTAQDATAQRQQLGYSVLQLLDSLSPTQLRALETPQRKKILFLASNPRDMTPLSLDEEIRAITQKLRAAKFRDEVELASVWATRPDDLLQELNVHRPVVVHFSGHGSPQGELCLMNADGQTKPVSAAALQKLFTALKDNVRLVVMNACFSETQARAISEVIDCVVGMGSAIGDKAAITWAAAFYSALGFGRSVTEAFEQGNTALMIEDIPESATPKLLVRPGADAGAVTLVA